LRGKFFENHPGDQTNVRKGGRSATLWVLSDEFEPVSVGGQTP
jgi:hypothetical protein